MSGEGQMADDISLHERKGEPKSTCLEWVFVKVADYDVWYEKMVEKSKGKGNRLAF